MLVILSPSKTMNENPEINSELTTTLPLYQNEAIKLSSYISSLNKAELAKLMKISDKLADQTWEQFQALKIHQVQGNQPALFSYTGEVYNGLLAIPMDDADINYAQANLRILSGMYGALRPLDSIMLYRLEMATKINIPPHKNLYTYWRDKITMALNKSVKHNQSSFLANLASDEYTKAIHLPQISVPIIHFDFWEMRNGKKKFVSFSAKRARGLMASFIIKNSVSKPDQLKQFNVEGYRYDATNSDQLHFSFVK